MTHDIKIKHSIEEEKSNKNNEVRTLHEMFLQDQLMRILCQPGSNWEEVINELIHVHGYDLQWYLEFRFIYLFYTNSLGTER